MPGTVRAQEERGRAPEKCFLWAPWRWRRESAAHCSTLRPPDIRQDSSGWTWNTRRQAPTTTSLHRRLSFLPGGLRFCHRRARALRKSQRRSPAATSTGTRRECPRRGAEVRSEDPRRRGACRSAAAGHTVEELPPRPPHYPLLIAPGPARGTSSPPSSPQQPRTPCGQQEVTMSGARGPEQAPAGERTPSPPPPSASSSSSPSCSSCLSPRFLARCVDYVFAEEDMTP